MQLISTFQKEAAQRSLWPFREKDVAHPLGAPEAFSLVRDMPYGLASSCEPLTTIREWRGTCSGKHYLLRILFSEFGLRADLMACTTLITAANAVYLSAAERELLRGSPVIANTIT